MALSKVQSNSIQSGAIEAAMSTPFGMRNRIINGDMRIDQRNAGSSITSSGFVVDRFQTISNTSDFTSNRSTTVPSNQDFKYSIYVKPTSTKSPSSGTYCAIITNVEGYNIDDLGWGTSVAKSIIVSFWVRSTKTGSYCFSTKNADATRSYSTTYTISASNTWEYKTLTIPGDTTGTWNSTNGRGLTADFWLAGNNTQSSIKDTWYAGNINMNTDQVNFFDSTSNEFYLTGVQLEIGTIATDFERRPYGIELQLCQRYYETSYPSGTRVGTSATAAFIHRNYASSSNLLIGNSWFRVTKRATPSCQNYDQNGNAGKVGINDNVTDPENYASFITNVTPNGMAVGTNGYNCNGFRYNFTAEAEL